MTDEAPSVPFERRLRYGLRQHRAEVSIVVFALGVLLSILALGDFTPLRTIEPFSSGQRGHQPAGGATTT